MPVLEAVPVIDEHRGRHDASHSLGVPPHVTVLFPFATPEELADRLGVLSDAISRVEPFTATFHRVERFAEEVTWLQPADDTGFRRLTDAAWVAFPEYAPYGGAHEDAVPHLTIGTAPPATPADLRAAAEAIETRLPLLTRVTEVHYGVVTSEPGSWRVCHRLALRRS